MDSENLAAKDSTAYTVYNIHKNNSTNDTNNNSTSENNSHEKSLVQKETFERNQ